MAMNWRTRWGPDRRASPRAVPWTRRTSGRSVRNDSSLRARTSATSASTAGPSEGWWGEGAHGRAGGQVVMVHSGQLEP